MRTAQMSSAMASAFDEKLNDDEQNVPLLGSHAGNRSVSPKDVKWGESVVNDMKKENVVNAGAVIELRGSDIYQTRI